MKHSWYKPIAICLCAALTLGSVTAAVYAQKEGISLSAVFLLTL